MNKIVIFGIGLIGGSLALALKRQLPALHVVGIDRPGENLHAAMELGVIDEAASDLGQALKHADMAVLAAPVAQSASIFTAMLPHLSQHIVITDVGSTKNDVITQAQAILGGKLARFVPGHPIAGAESSGVAAAHADLFHGKNVVLTPLAQTAENAVASVTRLWQLAGANVSSMSSAQHDSIFAAVSHLPHLLAFALVHELAQRPNAEQLFSFAASGFRDFTRIAGSSAEMWRDISLANRGALLQELQAYQGELAHIQTLLEKTDSVGLQALFEQASQSRNDWANRPEITQK